jgi:hypothetical protein
VKDVCDWNDGACRCPVVWTVFGATPDNVVYACNAHLGDVVKERATEWVGCWVDRA